MARDILDNVIRKSVHFTCWSSVVFAFEEEEGCFSFDFKILDMNENENGEPALGKGILELVLLYVLV